MYVGMCWVRRESTQVHREGGTVSSKGNKCSVCNHDGASSQGAGYVRGCGGHRYLLFFFFTFSTGYHTWCTSVMRKRVTVRFSFSTNRVPHLVYLCCFSIHRSSNLLRTDLLRTDLLDAHSHTPTHSRTLAQTLTHPPTHTHTHTRTHTHTHTL